MIRSGTFQFGTGLPGWTLNAGAGYRSFVSPDITFPSPFGSPPTVVLALSGLDAEHTANVRVSLDLAEVESDEFNLRVNTWDDSIIHSVVVTYIAFD